MAAKRKEKYYLNNPNLPATGAEFEYDSEMISEIEKCRENLLHFAENYFYILNLDEGKQKIKLYPAQKRVLEKLRDNRFFTLLASRQIGKCFSKDTLLKIRDKTTGEIKEIPASEFYSLSE